MTKKPKTPAWNSFTKAELIRTVKKLDKRQTQLLNEIVKVKGELQTAQNAVQPYTAADHEAFLRDHNLFVYPLNDALTNAFGEPRVTPNSLTSEAAYAAFVSEHGVALNSAEHPDTSDCLISEDALETVEIEIKPPAEQTGFVIATKRMPWETTDEGSGA